MSTENIVSVNLGPEEKGRVDGAVAELNTILKPLLVTMTPAQRQEIPKMGDGTAPIVEKTLDYATGNPEFAPPYMDVEELRIDLKAVEDLQSIYRPLLQLMQQLNDSIMRSGSEAYISALSYYNTVKLASRMNVPNAKPIFDDLKQRFVKARSEDGSDGGAGDSSNAGNAIQD